MRKITTKTVQNYSALEFSKDNTSQIMGVSSAAGVVKTFLLRDKGELAPLDSGLQMQAFK